MKLNINLFVNDLNQRRETDVRTPTWVKISEKNDRQTCTKHLFVFHRLHRAATHHCILALSGYKKEKDGVEKDGRARGGDSTPAVTGVGSRRGAGCFARIWESPRRLPGWLPGSSVGGASTHRILLEREVRLSPERARGARGRGEGKERAAVPDVCAGFSGTPPVGLKITRNERGVLTVYWYI
ncbi:hypothetical protein PAPYR_9226 [Paratrimastix pyriformis]|uniref:Uncharacterized protein n=1 Tax=Paratrimastix pyriformis TaxID=342808 RepID=A0ABQ8UCH5_9EUKA|nr:hypothetical protein PAPYR_9226 [Paratrimastix pyriformis]